MFVMTIIEEIVALDAEIKEMNLPFDKGLPILQRRLWEIAERHNTTGADIFHIYMDWKSGKVKHEE